MLSPKTLPKLVRRVGAACAYLALLQQAPIAHADPNCAIAAPTGELDPECVQDVGIPLCFVAPNGVPGLGGMPVWPATAADDPTATTRPEVSEPRWSSFPMQGMAVAKASSDPDQAHYRIVINDPANPSQAAVSIQLRTSTNTIQSVDFAYFGIATFDGKGAWGVRIPLTAAAAGAHAPITAGQMTSFSFGQTSAGWNETGGAPTWLSAASMWKFTTDDDANRTAIGLNGAKIAVQFKVDLAALGFRVGDQARVMIGVDNDFANDGTATTPLRIQYFTPNLARCSGGSCTYGTTGALMPTNPFLAKPAQWTPVSALGSACTGISIARQDISTPLTCGTNNTTTNCVTALKNGTNTFKASPTVPAEWAMYATPKILDPGDLQVQFKMSNWGSVGTAAQWVPLVMAANTVRSNDLKAIPVSGSCGANATAGTICGQAITADYTSPSFHQCLLAELSTPASTRDKVTFGNAAAYINTRFEQASTIDVPAQINIKGLPDPAPGQTTRDVYLLVQATNMRSVGTTTTSLNVDSLNALRKLADPGYSNPNVTCDQGLHDRCFPDGNGGGICRTPAFTNDGIYCLSGQPIDYGAQGFWCTTQAPETCTPPAGGAIDSDLSALSASQALTSQFPTYEVFPYYDSGTTFTVNGQTRKRLIPMSTFGIHAFHTGNFYGWSKTLLDSAGNQLPEVYPNVFKMSINKASGLATIRVRVTAEEQPPALFYQIAGNATPLGLGLGSANVTGLTRTPTFNLSKATVAFQKLLDNNGKELVTNFKGPVTLTRNAGASANLATFTFSKLGAPTIKMQVANLPLLGQTVSIQVTAASITAPASCSSGFGTAPIGTAFTIGDGTHTAVVAQGTDQWTCVPFQMLNF